jgi:hypothetical protein
VSRRDPRDSAVEVELTGQSDNSVMRAQMADTPSPRAISLSGYLSSRSVKSLVRSWLVRSGKSIFEPWQSHPKQSGLITMTETTLDVKVVSQSPVSSSPLVSSCK